MNTCSARTWTSAVLIAAASTTLAHAGGDDLIWLGGSDAFMSNNWTTGSPPQSNDRCEFETLGFFDVEMPPTRAAIRELRIRGGSPAFIGNPGSGVTVNGSFEVSNDASVCMFGTEINPEGLFMFGAFSSLTLANSAIRCEQDAFLAEGTVRVLSGGEFDVGPSAILALSPIQTFECLAASGGRISGAQISMGGGAARLRAVDGGVFDVDAIFSGTNPTFMLELDVDGASSVFECDEMDITGPGMADIFVTAQGVVTGDELNFDITDGLLSVSGAGSRVDLTGRLTVGDQLVVCDGAVIDVGDLTTGTNSTTTLDGAAIITESAGTQGDLLWTTGQISVTELCVDGQGWFSNMVLGPGQVLSATTSMFINSNDLLTIDGGLYQTDRLQLIRGEVILQSGACEVAGNLDVGSTNALPGDILVQGGSLSVGGDMTVARSGSIETSSAGHVSAHDVFVDGSEVRCENLPMLVGTAPSDSASNAMCIDSLDMWNSGTVVVTGEPLYARDGAVIEITDTGSELSAFEILLEPLEGGSVQARAIDGGLIESATSLTIRPGATLELGFGRVVAQSLLNDGTLSGFGLIDADLFNTGLFDITGNTDSTRVINLQTDGTLKMQAGSLLDSTAQITLAGTLELSEDNGPFTETEAGVAIITSDLPLSGAFDTIIADGYEVSVETNVVLVRAADSCPTDLNGDGFSTFADLTALLENWGPCADPDDCPWDFSGDGFATFADLSLLLQRWGAC